MYHEIDLKVKGYKSRQDLREIVVKKFLEEGPGTGTGDDTSHYRYNVETLANGKRVYLTRPARLKKGFDFLINVEGMQFQTNREYPKHDDIFDDLKQKQEKNPSMARKLYDAIKEVFECKDPDDVLPKYSSVNFGIGYSVELILKVLKWFFIEQDIRDWNYSGRLMFMGGVEEILL